ncbi:MAG TPA: hypothetical protein PLZ16_09530, partial [Gammaproteobacteria bacterium]|nr:hypothetical protein [Gammaproteobacteria bacterium]
SDILENAERCERRNNITHLNPGIDIEKSVVQSAPVGDLHIPPRQIIVVRISQLCNLPIYRTEQKTPWIARQIDAVVPAPAAIAGRLP